MNKKQSKWYAAGYVSILMLSIKECAKKKKIKTIGKKEKEKKPNSPSNVRFLRPAEAELE